MIRLSPPLPSPPLPPPPLSSPPLPPLLSYDRLLDELCGPTRKKCDTQSVLSELRRVRKLHPNHPKGTKVRSWRGLLKQVADLGMLDQVDKGVIEWIQRQSTKQAGVVSGLQDFNTHEWIQRQPTKQVGVVSSLLELNKAFPVPAPQMSLNINENTHNYIVDQQETLQLVFINDFMLQLNSHAILELQKCDKPMAFLVVYGPSRTGNSTLCNYLLPGTAKFRVGKELSDHTEGIWMSTPFKLPSGTYCVILDCQGHDNGDTNSVLLHFILSIASVVVCAQQLYISDGILEQLSIVRAIMCEVNGSDLPSLMFLLRDRWFTKAQALEYFHKRLADLPGHLQHAREAIKNFPTVELATIPHFRESGFWNSLEQFRSDVFGLCEPKKLPCSSTEMDGKGLADLVMCSVRAANRASSMITVRSPAQRLATYFDPILDNLCEEFRQRRTSGEQVSPQDLLETFEFGHKISVHKLAIRLHEIAMHTEIYKRT